MAASKSKNTGHSGRNTKKKTAMEQEVGRFQTEIILFVILAACVILMASNFGAGGFAGATAAHQQIRMGRLSLDHLVFQRGGDMLLPHHFLKGAGTPLAVKRLIQWPSSFSPKG